MAQCDCPRVPSSGAQRGLCPSSPRSPEPEGWLCPGCFGSSHKQQRVLVPRPCAWEQDNKSQLVHSRGVSLPSRSPVLRPPGQGAPASLLARWGGCRGPAVIPCRRVSPTLPGHLQSRRCSARVWHELRAIRGWELPAAAQGFQSLLVFPPRVCRHVGTWRTKPSRRGRAAAGIRESRLRGAAALVGEQEHRFSRDFPVKTCRRGMVQLSASSWSHQHLHLIAHR